jgi:oligopeptide transport system substrate-binding protein
MYYKKSSLILALIASSLAISSCSDKNKSSESNSSSSSSSTIINVDLGADLATLDPQMAEDVQSTRVAYDLFEGLVTSDQSNKPIPGLAEKLDISPDNKTYTFHLRPGIKFSDGTPITVDDILFSFQRLADPKTASPYNMLINNVVNGQAIIDGKAAVDTLGIKALDANTIQITLNHPDSSFLSICAMPNLSAVSKTNVTKLVFINLCYA